MTLTVGSLFSGIGGIDLGLERAGMTVKWHSEIEPYACRVLKKHWPDVPNIGDITKVDWKEIPYVDVLAGGYPCQPFSLAGKRNGQHDPRHLWPYFRTAISVLRPRYALLENVRGHLTLGGLSVIGDLAAIGYDCEWRVISAASVGANHRRDRLIIVAYPNVSGMEGPWPKFKSTGFGGTCSVVPHANSGGPEISETGKFAGKSVFGGNGRNRQIGNMANTNGGRRVKCEPETEQVSRFGGGSQQYDGWKWWKTEPNVGRVANGVPHRVDRLRGLGNAVVPQVAEVVGRLIMEHAQ